MTVPKTCDPQGWYQRRMRKMGAILLALGLVATGGDAVLARGVDVDKGGRQGSTAERRPPRRPPAPRDAPPRPHERRRGPPPALWMRMSEAERGRMLHFMEEHFPRLFLETEHLSERNPDRYDRRMKRIAPQMLRMMEMIETHPQRALLMIQERRLDMEMRHLARRYRTLREGPERHDLRQRMRELCERAFEARHRRRTLEIQELEARLQELVERHEQAAQVRAELIEREVKERLDGPVPRGRKEPPRP